MSNDPYINAALFNFCNRLDDGPRNPSSVPREQRSMEDLEWLRKALASIESPDKVLKQQLQILENAMGWDSLGGKRKEANETGKKKEEGSSANGDNKKKANEEEPQPSGLKLLANGTNPVTVDDVLNTLEWLMEELEDINMATEMCLMNGPAILLNLLQVTAANFVPPKPKAIGFAAPSATAATTVPSASAATEQVNTTTTTTAAVGAPALAVIPPAAAAATAPTTATAGDASSTPAAADPKKPFSRHGVFDTPNCVLKAPDVAGLSREPEVRAAVAKAIAHACQQNPKVQDSFAVHNWASVVVPMLAFEVQRYIDASKKKQDKKASSTTSSTTDVGTINGSTVAALLHLCSCMSRENDEGTKDFIKFNGLAILDEIVANPGRVSAKILKRALFFIEYLAFIGISNKGVIEHTANVVMMTGANQNTRIVTSSSSVGGGAAAVADPIEDSVLAGDAEVKNDLQRAAASALIATEEKGKAVVTDILKPMGLGAYLEKALPLAGVERDDIRWQLSEILRG